MIQISVAPLFHLELADRLQGTEMLTGSAQPALWNQGVCLFRLPEHLRQKWWDLVAKEFLEASADRQGFEQFVRDFRSFAEFKKMPLAGDAKFSVIIRAAGAENQNPIGSCQALVNLGDEPTQILLGGETLRLEPGDGCWSGQLDFGLAEVSSQTELDVLLRIQTGISNLS